MNYSREPVESETRRVYWSENPRGYEVIEDGLPEGIRREISLSDTEGIKKENLSERILPRIL